MTKKRKSNGRASFKGFVPYRLDKQLKERIVERMKGGLFVQDWLETWAQEGMKVTLRWEDDRECYFLMLYQEGEKHDNAGLILSARHSDLEKLVGTLDVLHNEVFAGVWSNPETDIDQYHW